MSMPDALRLFAQRVPLLDARFFVTAVLTQRESGGNLAEILDNLGDVIRERFRVKRQIRVVTAHGRMTGWVLTMIPPWSSPLVHVVVAPEHILTLVNDPLGIRMVVVAFVLWVLGYADHPQAHRHGVLSDARMPPSPSRSCSYGGGVRRLAGGARPEPPDRRAAPARADHGAAQGSAAGGVGAQADRAHRRRRPGAGARLEGRCRRRPRRCRGSGGGWRAPGSPARRRR